MKETKFIDAGADFKNRYFTGKVIIGCMRWYLKYPISYRNLEEMMQERGVEVDYTTIYRWVQKYAPEFHKRIALTAHKYHPYRINIGKHALYQSAINELRKERIVDDKTEHSQVKYLNNIIESDHGRVNRRLRPMLGFKSFTSAYRCIKGVETMIMFAKNQSFWITNNLKNQITFINKLFNLHSLDFAI